MVRSNQRAREQMIKVEYERGFVRTSCNTQKARLGALTLCGFVELVV